MEAKEKKDRKAQNKTLLKISTPSEFRIEQDSELDSRIRKEEGQQKTAQLPTKTDLETMFAALENSLKT